MPELRRWADLVACSAIAREESARTYVVPDRELAVQIEAVAAALGIDDLVTVVTSPFVPAGQVFVLDERAITAAAAQAVQRALRRPFGGWGPSVV